MNILRTTSTLMICCAALLSGYGATASSEGVRPRVEVPSEPTMPSYPAPSNAGIDGCWSADQHLYGRYRLSFCPNRHGGGHYRVTRNGLHCSAGLTWSRLGGTYQFAMQRAHCGKHTDWTADMFNCSLTYHRVGGLGRIEVPSGRGHLSCTYAPAVWGHPWTKFSAHRDS